MFFKAYPVKGYAFVFGSENDFAMEESVLKAAGTVSFTQKTRYNENVVLTFVQGGYSLILTNHKR